MSGAERHSIPIRRWFRLIHPIVESFPSGRDSDGVQGVLTSNCRRRGSGEQFSGVLTGSRQNLILGVLASSCRGSSQVDFSWSWAGFDSCCSIIVRVKTSTSYVLQRRSYTIPIRRKDRSSVHLRSTAVVISIRSSDMGRACFYNCPFLRSILIPKTVSCRRKFCSRHRSPGNDLSIFVVGF